MSNFASDWSRALCRSLTEALAMRLLVYRRSTHCAPCDSHVPRARSRGLPMADLRRGLTYAEAGVDIDAGNRMVELIKPLLRATARPGADAEIGGFGGLFDLKPAGFRDP